MNSNLKIVAFCFSVITILKCSALPNRSFPQNDLIADEQDIEVKRGSGIEDDNNPFDEIERTNRENDLTGLYQGDIVVIPDKNKVSDIPGGQDTLNQAINEKRNAINDKTQLWVGKVVPYVIDSNFSSVEYLIQAALNEIQNNSCISFKRRDSEKNYLQFILDKGCWSYVGRYIHGVNKISIGRGCHRKGIIIHEVLHALGFWHEQSRMDRDKHIAIFWENIAQGMESNFQKNLKHEMLVAYDYNSVMHYGPRAFSSNGKKTIVPVGNLSATIGQRDELSAKDITEINALYDCQTKSKDFYSTWGNWQPCTSSCLKSRQRFCSHTDFTKCPLVDLYGVQKETVNCRLIECNAPIAGNWGRWSSWNACSKTCGNGQTSRTRSCNDPTPKYGGSDCSGASLMSASCKQASCALGPYDCEFENGMCGWVNEQIGDRLDWTKKSGGTQSVETGPQSDHTSGKGSYMFLEASSPAKAGEKAILTTKLVTKSPTGKNCLTFWYHMYGRSMGDLAVHIVDGTTGAANNLLTLSGEQGNQWRKAENEFTATNDFRVQFIATRGGGFQSDMAIDDVYFKDGFCNASDNPLGMEDRRIKDYQLSSSSDWDLRHQPFYARLNQPGPNQWCSSWMKHGTDQFIRIDFAKRQIIAGVSIQGQATWDNWVTSYKIKYTEDGYLWKTLQENGIDKVFSGPNSRNTPVKHKFSTNIKTFAIIVNPQSYHGNDICMRMEVYGYEDPSQPTVPAGCQNNVMPLGMASGLIPNSQITATSIWDSNHQAYNARLNSYKVWCVSQNNNDDFQYLQVDFGKTMKVYAVATQGHPTWDNWVTRYEITYSVNGQLFYDILKDPATWTKAVFSGNKDRHTIVKNKFKTPLTARYIRIQPKSYIGNDICLRSEFFGCNPV